MAGIGLNAAKAKLQIDVQKALEDAFKATFVMGPGDFGNELAQKFAQKGAPGISDAIFNFISQAQIVGTSNGIITGACAVGPVTGTNINTFTGTELSII